MSVSISDDGKKTTVRIDSLISTIVRGHFASKSMTLLEIDHMIFFFVVHGQTLLASGKHINSVIDSYSVSSALICLITLFFFTWLLKSIYPHC